jgi:hypothetical protein
MVLHEGCFQKKFSCLRGMAYNLHFGRTLMQEKLHSIQINYRRRTFRRRSCDESPMVPVIRAFWQARLMASFYLDQVASAWEVRRTLGALLNQSPTPPTNRLRQPSGCRWKRTFLFWGVLGFPGQKSVRTGPCLHRV